MEQKNEILDLSFTLALRIIEFSENLEEARKFAIANQLIRSGTSVGANIREAQNAHSRADFISKMVISAKEANETEYWLLLCRDSKNYPDPGVLLDEIMSIKKLLSKIIAGAKRGAKT